MYDEFEQDDSWLRGGGGSGGSGQPPSDDDDLDFSWLDEDDSSESSAANPLGTGVTGQLDWRRVSGDISEHLPDDDELTFDWADDADGDVSPGSSRTGLTGQLDWQRATGNAPDWLSGEADDSVANPFDEESDFNLDLDAIGTPTAQETAFDADDDEDFDGGMFSSAIDDEDDEDSSLFTSTGFADDGEDEADSGLFGSIEEQIDEDDEVFAFQSPDAEDDSWSRRTFDTEPDAGDEITEAESHAAGAPGGRDIPDWLRDSMPSDSAASAPPASTPYATGPADVPAWLTGDSDDGPEIEDEHPSIARPALDRDLPDWLVEDEAGAEDEEDESWLRNVRQSRDTDGLMDESDMDVADANLPDWLSDVPVDEEPDFAESGQEASNLPDWMTDDEETFAGVSSSQQASEIDAMFGSTASIFGGDDDDSLDLLGALTSDLPDSGGYEGGYDDPLAALLEQADGDYDLLGELEGDTSATASPVDDDLLSYLDELEAEPTFSVDESEEAVAPGPLDDFFAGLLEDEQTPGRAAGDTGLADDLFAGMEFENADDADSDDADFGFDFDAETEDEDEGVVSRAADDFDWSESSDGGLFGQPPAASPVVPQASATNMDDMDWLRDIGAGDAGFDEFELEAETEEGDLDSYLASLQTDLPTYTPDSALALPPQDIDFESLFADSAFADIATEEEQAAEQRRKEESEIRRPDFLAGVTVGEVSAASIVRGQQDRPLEELSDRLMALRDEGMELNAPTSGMLDPVITDLLPSDAIAEAVIPIGLPGVSEKMVLSPEQRKRADILRSLAALEAAEHQAAPTRRRTRFKIGRLLVAVLVAAAVALPFFPAFQSLRIGTLPPARFVEQTLAQAAFTQINAIPDGALVLVAAEYGPTTSAELDGLTEAILRHVLLRGARPVIVSGNAVGLLRADTIMSRVGTGLTRNTDYYVGRYIVGDTVGLRAFSENIAELVRVDREGDPTGLTITSLDDFVLIVTIAEQSDGVRGWAEQIAPRTRTPLVFAVSQSAAPLAAPYAEANPDEVVGLLVGYRDSYTYTSLLEALISGGDISPLPAISPTPTPSDTPLPTETFTASPEPTVTSEPTEGPTSTPEVDETATDDPNATPEATGTADDSVAPPGASATPEPTDTEAPTPSPTLTPTFTATNTPTRTPTHTPSPTPSPTPETFAIINATQAVNMRSGPGTSFTVVGVLRPGERVKVLDVNSDQTWYRIEVPDIEEAWISATLLDLEPTATPPAEAFGIPGGGRGSTGRSAGVGIPAGAWEVIRIAQAGTETAVPDTTATDEPDATATPTLVEPTVESGTPTTAGTPTSVTGTPVYRDERWYGMTLGIIVSVIIIVVGNVINVLRNLTRRNK